MEHNAIDTLSGGKIEGSPSERAGTSLSQILEGSPSERAGTSLSQRLEGSPSERAGTSLSERDKHQAASSHKECSSPASLGRDGTDSSAAMGSPSSLGLGDAAEQESFAPPSECFLLKKQNAGVQIPYFLSSEAEVQKIRPPAVVKTWEQRFAELTAEQQQKFNAFEELVKKKEWYDAERYDSWCLIRYLTARSFDTSKAMQQLEKTVEWLKDPANSSTFCEICQENPNQHCGQFMGWDLQHRPVMFMSMRWGPERKHPLKHMIAAFNHLVKMMPVGVEKWVCMTDFETYSHMRDSNPSMGISVIQAIQTHFPERLGKMICINPPTMFWVLWKLFSPVIDPPTKEKVEFLYTEDKPSVYESFPKLFPEHLCQYLYDAYDRSKYSVLADPLIWHPTLPYPSNYEERKAELKNIKKRLENSKKEAKEREKATKKQEKKDKEAQKALADKQKGQK